MNRKYPTAKENKEMKENVLIFKLCVMFGEYKEIKFIPFCNSTLN